MGGSGSTGAGTGGGTSGGDDCPRKFEAIAADVIQTGNAAYAFHLQSGAKVRLSVIANDTAVLLTHDETTIGYLPPQRLNIIQCINQGWTYSASVVEVSGTEQSPRVKILVVGVPPA